MQHALKPKFWASISYTEGREGPLGVRGEDGDLRRWLGEKQSQKVETQPQVPIVDGLVVWGLHMEGNPSLTSFGGSPGSTDH